MSSLRNLRNPTPELVVQVSDGEGFPVRGLSPTHVLGLYNRHTGQLSNLFEQLADRHAATGSVDPSDMEAMVLGLLDEAPVIMAELIALASGSDVTDTDNWAIDLSIAAALPFPIQVDALMKIAALTFTSDMPAGKFSALVAGAIKNRSATTSAT